MGKVHFKQRWGEGRGDRGAGGATGGTKIEHKALAALKNSEKC